MSGVIALIVAVTGLIAAVTGLIALFRKVQQVHVLVNANMQELGSRVTQLTAALTRAGVDVPAAPGQGEAGSSSLSAGVQNRTPAERSLGPGEAGERLAP